MANPFTVQPLGGLQSVANIQQGMQGIAQNFQQDAAEEKRQALMQKASEVFERGDPREIAQFSIQNPEMGKSLQETFGFTNEQTKPIVMNTYQQAMANPDRAAEIMQQGIEQVSAAGGRPTNMTRDLQLLQQNPDAGLKSIEMGFAAAAPDVYEQFYGGGMNEPTPAAVRAFEAKAAAAGLEPGTPEYQRAAKVDLGVAPRAGISAAERIAADKEKTRQVAELERQKTAAKATGKLEIQREMLPGIRKSIKAAEQQAQSRGEALSEYERAQAAQPGLEEVVNKLKTLSDVATYTMGGKVFDTVVKELGFGATEGATARAKMESLVNNQILPLLRDTFGAQFTEREGEQLRKTMMDIDAAPEQKKEILDSFIGQKMRDLEMKRERVEDTGSAPQSSGQSEPARIRLDAEGNIIQ